MKLKKTKKTKKTKKEITEHERELKRSESTGEEIERTGLLVEKRDDKSFRVGCVPVRRGVAVVVMHVEVGGENKVIYEKHFDVVYDPSPETSKLELLNENQPIFESITTAKIVLNLSTSSGDPINGPVDSSAIKLGYRLIQNRSSYPGSPEVETSLSEGSEPGQLIGNLFTNCAGDYEIFLTINGKQLSQKPLKLNVKNKPLWELNGSFSSGTPGVPQKVTLTHKDRNGGKISSKDMIKCTVFSQNKETREIFSEGNETDREIVWTPLRCGPYHLDIYIEEHAVFKFGNVMIKNPVCAQKSKFACKNTALIPLNQPISFEITLKDDEGGLIKQAGDEVFLTVGYKLIALNEKMEKFDIETEIKEITAKSNGVYGFSFTSKNYAEYYFFAKYERELIPESPLKVGVFPQATGDANVLETDALSAVEDDNVFLKCFQKFAENGTNMKKFRYKPKVFGGETSQGKLKLINAFSDDVAFVYKKLVCPLINVSSVNKGKRTTVFRTKDVDPSLCFSIITNSRSIDFVVNKTEVRDVWVRGLTLILDLENIKKKSIYRSF